MKKNDTFLVQLTVEDLLEILKKNFPVLAQKPEPKEEPKPKKEEEGPTFTGRLVYGVVGIERLFNVSHKTAQQWKDGWMKPAIKQRGRKIVTDVAYAMKLFDKIKKPEAQKKTKAGHRK